MSKSVEEKQKEKLYEIKIVLLGDPAVGKSSIVQRFCQDKFEENYKLTIGGAYLQKDVKLKNGDILKLHIWDTGGQEKFRSIAQMHYKDAGVVILVFDITRQDSFESIKNYWYPQVKEKAPQNAIIALIASK